MANAIRSSGVSASWQKGQRDAVRIFNDFLKQDEEESEGTALTSGELGMVFFAAVRFMNVCVFPHLHLQNFREPEHGELPRGGVGAEPSRGGDAAGASQVRGPGLGGYQVNLYVRRPEQQVEGRDVV